MKTARFIKIIITIQIQLFIFPAVALDISDINGDDIIKKSSPRGITEVCIIPHRISSNAKYSEKDRETEDKLCSFDFYSTHLACPKLNSTNPGVLISGKEVLSQCSPSSKGKNKTLAKFKQSTSCSYTPSILSYYHFSRQLGGLLNIKPSVLRTMDKTEHIKISRLGVRWAPRGEIIAKTWSNLLKEHQQRFLNPKLFDVRGEQIYGAIQAETKGEMLYSELNRRRSYESGTRDFKNSIYFKRVASAASLNSIFSAERISTLAKRVALVMQMKDISEMVLLDSLLNQFDRVGNIHYYPMWYWVESGKIKKEKAKIDERTEKIIPHQDPTAFFVKEMVLKDNDCGIAKENLMLSEKVIHEVRHLDPKTYMNFLKLVELINSTHGKQFLMEDLLFSEKDYSSIKANANLIKSLLVQKCQSKSLKLDLSIEAIVSGQVPPQVSCSGNEFEF